MQTSWTLFKLFGIPIRANLSVGLLAVYLLISVGRFVPGLYFVAVLLVSILLHELAHSVVAMAFGGQVREITLQLLGGCATITRMPSKPWHECWMALAGPGCSFLLAALAWVPATLLAKTYVIPGYGGQPPVVEMIPNIWFSAIVWINLVLGAFNLIPAFPMDGGRVLRALLQAVGRRTKVRATEIAVSVGRGFAVLWAAVSVLTLLGVALPKPSELPEAMAFVWELLFGSGGVLLLCIAYMIWVSGKRELEMVRAEAAYYGGWR